MRDAGLESAIEIAGGVGALARALGISQPSVSNWQKVPSERVLAVEAVTGVSRSLLRPDLYPPEDAPPAAAPEDIDELDLVRSQEYGLLALLLGRAPTAEVLNAVGQLKGDASPLGMAHLTLAAAAAEIRPDEAQREFFDLFVGLGRGELLPFGSFYLTGFLHERPLARVREDLAALGIERAENLYDPEDHIAILCETMAGLVDGRFGAGPGADGRFFQRHLQPWAARFFADLAIAPSARFYKSVAAVGQVFMEIETKAHAMDA